MNANVKIKEQNKKDRIKILITGIVSLILIICIVGYTYSYFVVKDTDNITITGTVASGELEIEVNQLAPGGEYQNKGLVPQLDGAIRNAVVGKNNLNCVDDNYNSVCRVYEVVVTNKSNMSAKLDGYITLDAGNNPNLKWALIDYDVNSPQTKPTLESDMNSYQTITMVENVEFGAYGSENATKKYYVVIWISEIGGEQYDTGLFTGEIVFKPTKYTSYVLKMSNEVTSDAIEFLDTSIERNLIHSINFIDTDDIEYLMENENVEVLEGATSNEGEIPYFDVSILEDDSVKLYYKNYTDTEGNNLYDVMIGTDTGITLASSGYYLFSYLTNMENINLDNLDTSMVIDMSYMFRNSVSLTTLSVNSLDTSNVTDIRSMFGGKGQDMALTEIIGLDKFKTSKVYNMSGMFQRCSSLSEINVSNFDTSKVTNMSYMFNKCNALDSIDLDDFDTSKVTDMSFMFRYCYNLSTINVSSFDTSKVTNMREIFNECTGLTSLNLTGFDTSKVTNMRMMFSKCYALTEIKGLNSFDTSKVSDMGGMFQLCELLKSFDLSSFNTSNVVDMQNMFGYCSSLTTIDVSSFDTSNVINMAGMFINCTDLGTIYVSDSFVTINASSDSMFYGCTSLVGGSGTLFDASNVDKTYAIIDGGVSSPGYFTLKIA